MGRVGDRLMKNHRQRRDEGTDKLTGFHAARSSGGVGSNIQANDADGSAPGVAKPNVRLGRR